ncbi:MAG: SLC13 family permease [Mucilaginibacter sp.]|uniref:GntP family permease n=1 Tax=Mucilaginibacter sp. TaxID=1882438 RepID=UPI003266C8B9
MQNIITDPVFILAAGILVVVAGIIGFKLHPFLAMLFGALVVAMLTPAFSVEQYALNKGMSAKAALELSHKNIGERVAIEFGNTCAKIGVLIAMASIIGKCLLESGAAERIIRSILKLTGINKAPVAFLVSSFFIGIPVFFDTVLLLMIPLAKAITVRIGKNYLLFIMCIMAGAAMANSLVPPAPGPLFLVGEMHVPIGMMMIGGTFLGLITITSGYAYAAWANKKWPVPLRDSVDAHLEDIEEISRKDTSQLPGLGISLMPVLIPLLFICFNTILTSLPATNLKGGGAAFTALISTVEFMGDKNMALVIGGIAALIILAMQKRAGKEAIGTSVQAALMGGGGIILIIAAGGAFGGMLQQSGISMRIADLTKNYQMALIPLAFFITAIVRTAQGSATVALITASGILSGMATGAHLSYHPLYLCLAIGCGSKLVPWMNDAGFWVVCRVSNLTEREALKTISPLLAIMGISGLIAIMIAAKLLPSI